MGPNIDDLADDRTRGIQSEGEDYHDAFLLKRPKTEWSPYIDETAKDLSSGIQIGDLTLSKDDFGTELGTYYRRGLEKTAGRYTDLPSVLEREVNDRQLGVLAYRLNELSYDITTTDRGIDNVQEATEAVIEKLLTRHVGNELSLSFDLSGGTVSDIVTQVFKSETIASNVDALMNEFEESASRGFLSLMDEPQMMIPLWDHQREALEKWNENDNRGYVDMATATGKTVLGLGALALQYGELHPNDQGVGGLVKQQNPTGSDDILIVAHSELILEQWRREFENHLNIPQERTTGGDDITLEWGTIHFRTPQSLISEDRVAYELVLLDEAHHYATGSEWGSLLDEFDGDVLAMSGSVDDAGSDSERIKERLSNSIGPEVKRYTITEARADGVIPSFDWEVHYAPYDAVGGDLKTVSKRSEQAFQDFQKKINRGEISLDTDRRLRTYEDVRRFSHTTEGNTLKQQNDSFRDLVTRLFSHQTKQWNLSPVLDAVVDLVVEHSTTEKVVVLADSNAQVEELESRLNDVADPSSIYLVAGSQSRSEQRETIDEFDEPESSGILLGTGDLLGEGVDMQHASVAINMATGGVNPELVQRIGRVLRNPDDTPKHAMFYNVVGIPPTKEAAVPREDGKRILKQAAGFCSLGRRLDTLPGFSKANSVDTGVLETILDGGATFIETLDADGEYDWNEGVAERDDLEALHNIGRADSGDVETILGKWEEYAWEHSKDEQKSSADTTSDDSLGEQKRMAETTDEQHDNASEAETGSIKDIPEPTRSHIGDLVRLQPTKNFELQKKWGLSSEREIHDHLRSDLGDYYFRGFDNLIWASDEAEALIDGHSTRTEESGAEGDKANGEVIQNPSKSDLLNEIARLEDDLGELPTKARMTDQGRYEAARYEETFGSWTEAVREAGFEPLSTQRPGYTSEEVLSGLREIASDLGKPPSPNDINDHAEFSSAVIYNHFDSITAARKAAGVSDVSTTSRQQPYTRDEVISGLREVASDLGSPPSTKDINDHAEFSSAIIYNHFDSIFDARETAGVNEASFASPDSIKAESDTAGITEKGEPEDSSGTQSSSPDIAVSPLAEYYELFRRFGSLLDRLVESERTSYRTDRDQPMNRWREQIENIVYGSGLGDDSQSYGQQQRTQNQVKISEYRQAFGNGETVTDYQSIRTVQPDDDDFETLAGNEIIDPGEQVHLPIAPDSDIKLPIVVSTEAELAAATDLLQEFPLEPEPAPKTQSNSSSPSESSDQDHNFDPPTEDLHTDDEGDVAQDRRVQAADSASADVETDSATDQVIFWDRDAEQITKYDNEDTENVDKNTTSNGDSLDEKIDEWRSQLLDLTRRNKLISFKPTKTKSLPFEEGDPMAIADELDNDGELYIRKQSDLGEASGESTTDYDESTELAANELVPIRTAEEAENSLYQIELKNKAYLRERGVDSLYLSLGMLRWYSVDYSDDANRSPLFLAPVELEEKTLQDSDRHDYVLKPKVQGLQLNPALRKKLAAERGINLPADTALSLE